jgi:hypothetical protein
VHNRSSLSMASAAALLVSLSIPSSAQVDTRVIVPESPGGANFGGCYRADRDLFGPYRLTMCFERGGTYTIRGGARCDGQLSWRVSGRDITVELRRASCRRGVAWERATATCRPTGGLMGAVVRDALSRVITSNLPRVRTLDCIYRPTVRGHRNTEFRANRR